MKLRAILAATAALATVGVASVPASAGSNSGVSYTTGAAAQFLHSGDKLRVTDTASDGESVWGQYRVNGGSIKNTSQWNGGYDTRYDYSTGNPAEGATVTIRSAHQDELDPDDFGAWKQGTA